MSVKTLTPSPQQVVPNRSRVTPPPAQATVHASIIAQPDTLGSSTRCMSAPREKVHTPRPRAPLRHGSAQGLPTVHGRHWPAPGGRMTDKPPEPRLELL